MSTQAQVDENLVSADRSGRGSLTEADLELIGEVRAEYQRLAPIPCTDCKYCQPCPNGVAIPRIFEMYNESVVYGDTRRSQSTYQGQGPQGMKPEERADQCLECGECIEACPQKIEIPDQLKKAHELLGAKP